MVGSRKLRLAAENYWIHPELRRKLVNVCWDEIGVEKHCLFDEHDPLNNYKIFRQSTFLAETVLRAIGEKTMEDMEDEI